jgi:hypothetical protein
MYILKIEHMRSIYVHPTRVEPSDRVQFRLKSFDIFAVFGGAGPNPGSKAR